MKTQVYDLIFSRDVWTPTATILSATIKNLVEIPVIYLIQGSYLIHVADANKGLHDCQETYNKLYGVSGS